MDFRPTFLYCTVLYTWFKQYEYYRLKEIYTAYILVMFSFYYQKWNSTSYFSFLSSLVFILKKLIESSSIKVQWTLTCSYGYMLLNTKQTLTISWACHYKYTWSMRRVMRRCGSLITAIVFSPGLLSQHWARSEEDQPGTDRLR